MRPARTARSGPTSTSRERSGARRTAPTRRRVRRVRRSGRSSRSRSTTPARRIERMSESVLVVGAGLAGSEAAWQLARRGIGVELLEMRPEKSTPAHRTPRAAELVCTTSFKSDVPEVAAGLLKEELRRLGSLVLRAADRARVPSGQDLSVDGDAFASAVGAGLADAGVRRVAGELTAIDPARTTIVATGPLTSPDLAAAIERLTGQKHLHFYDAAAPIVVGESLDQTLLFRASRYGKGGDAYLNIPLDRAQYEAFVAALVAAEQVELHDFEQTMWFEACLPVEELARRGPETLRFGPLKPLGLTDPVTGKRPYAVVQLRPDDAASDLYNLVGFQTNLRWPDQRRIIRSLPGLARAEFARLGVMHRNTYVNSPALLAPSHRLRSAERTYRAAQQLSFAVGEERPDILRALTAEQGEAVEHGEGPLLIVAGAGTGKTHVLTARIVELIASGRARPHQILALTFTEKAAATMQERVDLYTPLGHNDAAIPTFHSFGDDVFPAFALALGRAGELRVLSPAEQVIFVREHLFELPLKRYRPAGDPVRHVRALLDLFGRARDDDISPRDYVAFAARMRPEAADDATPSEAEAQAELAATYLAYTSLKEQHRE